MSRHKGLYQAPSNMLRATPSGPRPNFNTMSFAEPKLAPKQVIEEASHLVNDLASIERKRDKKTRKSLGADKNDQMSAPHTPAADEKVKKNKRPSQGPAAEQEATTKLTTAEVAGGEPVPMSGGAEEVRIKKKKRKSLHATVEDEVFANTKTPETTAKRTTTTASGAEKQKSSRKPKHQDGDNVEQASNLSAKKRKRDSELRADASSTAQDGVENNNVLLGRDWLRDLESTMGNIGANFDFPQPENPSTETPAKKRARTKRKSVELSVAEPQEEQVIVSLVEPVIDTTLKEATSANKEKKRKKEKKGESTQVLDDAAQSCPLIRKDKPQAGSPFARELVNTPIPLPPNSSLGTARDIASPQQQRFQKGLSDQAKLHPRGARSSSVSSASSMSIKDAFLRAPKLSPPYITSNPFLTPISRQKVDNGDHQKADFQSFISAFQTFQGSVNMINEQVYLDQHLDLRAANDAAGPLPCLKSATGCSSKAEEHIRMLKENSTNLLKTTTANSGEHQLAFEVSVAATTEAEKFLHNAVITGIPIPAGNLEGTYTLYCPKYAETHIDKYGFGLRKLVISKPSGFVGNTYTACIVIPPRPMSYTVLSFDPPTNASFRTTKLTTSAEGYTMDLVVLGNGYILLRVDIGLFLTGKRTVMGENAGEEICMELVGMKKGATMWSGIEDVKMVKERDLQCVKDLAEKAAADKIAKDKAWVSRKEEMMREKERLKAGTMHGLSSSPAMPKAAPMSAPPTPKMSKTATANGVSNSTVKPKTATTRVALSTPKKTKTTTATVFVDGVSPSPKKRGRPTDAEIIRRAKEKEAADRAKA